MSTESTEPEEVTETDVPAEGGEEEEPAEAVSAAEGLSEFTSETPAPASVRPRRPAPGQGYGTGRRKTAVARVRIVPGSGQWKINGQRLEAYFPNTVHQQTVKEPLSTANAEERYDVLVRLHGGGSSGQAGAVQMGLARGLSEVDPENNRPALKKAGYLTRDSRTKERKKYGLKKARKAPQFTKR